jgi:hypothetical protein
MPRLSMTVVEQYQESVRLAQAVAGRGRNRYSVSLDCDGRGVAWRFRALCCRGGRHP